MRVGSALGNVHRRVAFEFPVAAVVIGRGEDHGVVGAEFGETTVAPMGGDLRRELGVIFLQADVGTAVFEFSNNHDFLLCFL